RRRAAGVGAGDPARADAPARSSEPALFGGHVAGPRTDGTARPRRTRAVSELAAPRHLARGLAARQKRTGGAGESPLPTPLALPIFAADAISSVAYATEAAMVVLLTA